MTSRTSALGIFLLSIFTALPISADWQYTRWGMSVAEVIQSSKGSATRQPLPGLENVLHAPYTVGDYHFTARFQFDNSGKLIAVSLSCDDAAQRQAVIDELLKKYGSPIRDDHTVNYSARHLTWRASETKDSIDAVYDGYGCTITYAPLSSGNGF